MSIYIEQLQQIVRKYRQEGQPWPASSRAIANRSWQIHPSALISQCAEQISRAMREEYITDPQGRRVRAKHSARVEREGEQLVLWDDIRTATREHLGIAFKQRRQQIVGDCQQLKADVDSFNENRSPLNPIQIRFDFTKDLADLEAVPV